MEPIIGTVSVTEQPDTIATPAPPHTYFGVAQSLMPGVKVLAAASSSSALALFLVAAHVLECLLKAYLSKDGSDVAVKDQNVRHNLNALWAMAFAQGLRIPESPPISWPFVHGWNSEPHTPGTLPTPTHPAALET